MRRTIGAAVFAILLPGLAGAQEPVKRFEELNTRLRVGDTIYVTDSQGRQRGGKILDLSASSLTLDAAGPQTLASSDVRIVKEREPDSLKGGALIGLLVGAGVGGGFAAWFCSNGEGCESGGALLGVGLYAAMGAGIGTGIDAAIPGKKRVVYHAGGGTGSASVSLAPVLTPRRQGLALLISF